MYLLSFVKIFWGDCYFGSFFLPFLFFVVFSCDLLTMFSVMFGLVLLFYVCDHYSYLTSSFPCILTYPSICVQNCFIFLVSLISNPFSMFCICPLLMLASLDIVFVNGWLSTFKLSLPLPVSFLIFNILVSKVAFPFLLREFLLVLDVELIWRCWIILTFACLWSFWCLHQIWMRALLGRL